MNTATSERLARIDALRGIAALLVVWNHVAEEFIRLPGIAQRGTVLATLSYRVDFGRIGVATFFAISGFVIPPGLRGGRIDGSVEFAIKRFFRLFPAYWLSMFLWTAFFLWPFGTPPGLSTYAANLIMLPSLLGREAIMGLYWTLETELAFYALVWFLFLAGVLRRPAVLLAVGLALLAVYVSWMFGIARGPSHPTWFIAPHNLSLMLWGALVRMWHDDKTRPLFSIVRISVRISWVLAPFSLLLCIPSFVLMSRYMANGHLSLIRQAAPYPIAIALFAIVTVWVPLEHRFLAWLGAISYSVYLFHPVVFYFIFYRLLTLPPSYGSQHLGVYLAVSATLSVFVGAGIYACIEKPAIDWGRRVLDARRARLAAASLA